MGGGARFRWWKGVEKLSNGDVGPCSEVTKRSLALSRSEVQEDFFSFGASAYLARSLEALYFTGNFGRLNTTSITPST